MGKDKQGVVFAFGKFSLQFNALNSEHCRWRVFAVGV
jgi:hypothetical protein